MRSLRWLVRPSSRVSTTSTGTPPSPLPRGLITTPSSRTRMLTVVPSSMPSTAIGPSGLFTVPAVTTPLIRFIWPNSLATNSSAGW